MTTHTYRYEDGLQSERLITRFLAAEDAVPWNSFFEDKDAVELFPERFFAPGQDNGANWVNRQIERYNNNHFGLQAIMNKHTGEFIGQCGLLLQEVDGIAEVEVGYHMFRKHWGKGYAPEAAKLFIDYAINHNITSSVISIIDVRNFRSQNVAEKNGLRREKQTLWNELDVFIYRSAQR